MTIDCIDEVPGASELRTWFGGFPSFHDAYADLEIHGDGNGHLKIKAFRMTDKVDARGYFVLEKYCLVTLIFGEVTAVQLGDYFQPRHQEGIRRIRDCRRIFLRL